MIVQPLHLHYSPWFLRVVINRMIDLGPPTLRAYFDTETGVWFAHEDTHRLRAAAHLGFTPTMLHSPWRKGKKALARARCRLSRSGFIFSDEAHLILQ
jgi:hypothetical protein